MNKALIRSTQHNAIPSRWRVHVWRAPACLGLLLRVAMTREDEAHRCSSGSIQGRPRGSDTSCQRCHYCAVDSMIISPQRAMVGEINHSQHQLQRGVPQCGDTVTARVRNTTLFNVIFFFLNIATLKYIQYKKTTG